ncbi:MAG: sodium ion-translocating decarboxylase subunit beta [Anaerolineae bacterium]
MLHQVISQWYTALPHLAWGHLVMMAVGGALIYLAVVHEYEPMLLLPIGMGAIIANIPLTGMTDSDGLFGLLYRVGIDTELFPLLIFVGMGALTDFGPLLENPRLALLGAAGQIGIFTTILLALGIGFDLNEAAPIGIIGAIDGPTAIYVSSLLAPELLAPIAVTAYSYMALIPIIQPPLMRWLTTPEERKIRMPYTVRPVSRAARIVFPIAVTVIIGLIVPTAVPLVSMLMFGNLLRESGVVDRLVQSASNELANVVTLLLGLVIGSTMTAERFLRLDTLAILALGLLAFCLDIVGGLLLGKMMSRLSGGRINPLVGAAGISAFPMAARAVQRAGQEADFESFLLMHAMGANTAGQIASVIAGGIVLWWLM